MAKSFNTQKKFVSKNNNEETTPVKGKNKKTVKRFTTEVLDLRSIRSYSDLVHHHTELIN